MVFAGSGRVRFCFGNASSGRFGFDNASCGSGRVRLDAIPNLKSYSHNIQIRISLLFLGPLFCPFLASFLDPLFCPPFASFLGPLFFPPFASFLGPLFCPFLPRFWSLSFSQEPFWAPKKGVAKEEKFATTKRL